MSVNSKLRNMRREFKQKGGPAMKNARKKMLQKFKDSSLSSQALRYFAKVTLHNSLPVFEALIAMSCEAVGGRPEKTTPFGEAIVLISSGADLHDDVIDQSFIKGSKQTVLGKFNQSTAILAGDILLVKGIKQLTDASEFIPKKQAKEILELVSDAVIEICTAEALEIQMHNRLDLTPDEYHEVIRLKAVVPELAMKIGAIIGNGNSRDVKSLGQFGRTYGINSIIIEEFADLLDIEELRNRLKNECPPLPIIYCLQNPEMKTNLVPLLSVDLMDENIHKKIVETVLKSPESHVLEKVLVSNVTIEQKQLSKKINEKMRGELMNLLLCPLNYFEN
jgi:geranylgeranyl pyrophosphate synthase